MTKSLPYRPNVGIMVLNTDGKAWIGKRIADPGNEYRGQAKLWQMPQGGVDEGEDLLAAAKRELQEETGITSVELLDQTDDWITYDFPKDAPSKLTKKWSGQKQIWFLFRFTGQDQEISINPPAGGPEAEFSDWRWEEVENFADLIVPFKQHVYQQVVKRFEAWLT